MRNRPIVYGETEHLSASGAARVLLERLRKVDPNIHLYDHDDEETGSSYRALNAAARYVRRGRARRGGIVSDETIAIAIDVIEEAISAIASGKRAMEASNCARDRGDSTPVGFDRTRIEAMSLARARLTGALYQLRKRESRR